MSRHHENILWQNEAGRWSLGLFKRVSGSGSFNPDYDSEWDDDFDTTEFCFASSGHPTQEKAYASWTGPNPGGTSAVYFWNKENATEILEFQDMAKACNNPAYAAERKMKIENAKAKKFQTELRDRLREKTIGEGQYRVKISLNSGRVVDAYGISTTFTARLYRDGDWLLAKYIDRKNKTVEVKVWNTKTRMQGPKVLDIENEVPFYRW